MAGIDDIGNGSSGTFDFSKEAAKEEATQVRLQEDTRKFTKGNENPDFEESHTSAGPDPRIGRDFPTSAERNKQRAVEAGLVTPAVVTEPKFDIAASIFKSEASVKDRNEGTYSAYFDINKEPVIGPGLNLDSHLVRQALKKRGFDPEELKGRFDFGGKEVVDEGTQKMLEGVFTEVVEGARNDARTYVGKGTWDNLKQHERDALTDMSYNLGLTKLKGFKNLKAAIIALSGARSPEMVSVAVAQMADSKWFNQVGNRAQKVMLMFANGEDEPTKRYLRGLDGAN